MYHDRDRIEAETDWEKWEDGLVQCDPQNLKAELHLSSALGFRSLLYNIYKSRMELKGAIFLLLELKSGVQYNQIYRFSSRKEFWSGGIQLHRYIED